jgi:hypothetical protein
MSNPELLLPSISQTEMLGVVDGLADQTPYYYQQYTAAAIDLRERNTIANETIRDILCPVTAEIMSSIPSEQRKLMEYYMNGARVGYYLLRLGYSEEGMDIPTVQETWVDPWTKEHNSPTAETAEEVLDDQLCIVRNEFEEYTWAVTRWGDCVAEMDSDISDRRSLSLHASAAESGAAQIYIHVRDHEAKQRSERQEKVDETFKDLMKGIFPDEFK